MPLGMNAVPRIVRLSRLHSKVSIEILCELQDSICSGKSVEVSTCPIAGDRLLINAINAIKMEITLFIGLILSY